MGHAHTLDSVELETKLLNFLVCKATDGHRIAFSFFFLFNGCALVSFDVFKMTEFVQSCSLVWQIQREFWISVHEAWVADRFSDPY